MGAGQCVLRWLRRMTGRLRAQARDRVIPLPLGAPRQASRLPPVELAVIGAEHAGTTALVRRLASHPAFHTHRTEEMTYFASHDEHAHGYLQAFRHHYGAAPDDTVLVARCDAMLDVPASLDRLAEHNPATHVVVMLRHPVERAWAAYWHARHRRLEALPRFETAIAAEELGHGERRYLGRGKYSRQLAHLFGRFPARQVHVFITEDVAADPGAACERLWSIFEAGPPASVRAATADADHPPGSGAALLPALHRACAWLRGRGGSPPSVPEPLRKRLIAYYEPYNQELEHMLGRDLGAWRR